MVPWWSRRSSPLWQSVSDCLPHSRSTLPSMYLCLSLSSSAHYSLLSRPLHPPGLLMAIRRSQFTRFWTLVAGGAACSISSTGRAMDQRRGAGFPGSGFWMPPSYGRSIALTLRSLEDRLEALVRGGGYCHETPVVILAALRLLVGVVSNVPVCSSPLSSTPVPHHAINSIKHTCSTSCNLLTYKSQFYFPVPAGSLNHSVWVHASQSLSWSVCILSVSEELRANPFFPVLTAEIQPEPLTQISH